MTTDSSPLPEGEPPVPDDVWDRFLADSERDIRATAPKEPSARARIVARRLREEDERAAAEAPRRRRLWRRGGPTQAAPPAWRSGATDAGERRLARRRRVRAVVGIVVVVLVLLVVLAPGRAWSLVNGDGWKHHGGTGTSTGTPVLHAAGPAPTPAAAPGS